MKVHETITTFPADIKKMLEDRGEQAFLEPCEEISVLDDGHIFVNIRSYHEGARIEDTDSHPTFRSLLGKRVRITIEAIDSEVPSKIDLDALRDFALEMMANGQAGCEAPDGAPEDSVSVSAPAQDLVRMGGDLMRLLHGIDPSLVD